MSSRSVPFDCRSKTVAWWPPAPISSPATRRLLHPRRLLRRPFRSPFRPPFRRPFRRRRPWWSDRLRRFRWPPSRRRRRSRRNHVRPSLSTRRRRCWPRRRRWWPTPRSSSRRRCFRRRATKKRTRRSRWSGPCRWQPMPSASRPYSTGLTPRRHRRRTPLLPPLVARRLSSEWLPSLNPIPRLQRQGETFKMLKNLDTAQLWAQGHFNFLHRR